jgi:tRNA-splicing ligase RtcB
MSPTRHGNLLSWASDIEPGTLAQAAKAASMPFVQGHLALMPDAHVGKGATIGSVIPTTGAVIPAAVGVDIGCGMIAVETSLSASALPDSLDPLLSRVEQVVPAGVGKGHEGGRSVALPPGMPPLTPKQQATAVAQFGSLGSGNHFVEVSLDERDVVWLVLHSGSRGIGNQLATSHIEGAKGLMKELFVSLPDPDLAYLVEGTPAFDAYITAMLWAQDYAMANRAAMVDAVLPELFRACGGAGREVGRVNCHHNFTEREHHDGHDVWLTRKGAIRARVGDRGVIPGSMGTRSYIVRGKGNPASYCSCSHGAGRRLSRGAARRQLTTESLAEAMAGRTWNADRAAALLDEHPASYKDIDVVMADQADLVEVEHTLRQVLNYKGT